MPRKAKTTDTATDTGGYTMREADIPIGDMVKVCVFTVKEVSIHTCHVG